ncbi:MAG TPA: hypothetical protein VMX13_00935 [Sedimentisphaerales bacterium]|nr:hypothetical protein [Sedimentisphaerales bacterium]
MSRDKTGGGKDGGEEKKRWLVTRQKDGGQARHKERRVNPAEEPARRTAGKRRTSLGGHFARCEDLRKWPGSSMANLVRGAVALLVEGDWKVIVTNRVGIVGGLGMQRKRDGGIAAVPLIGETVKGWSAA